MSGTEIASEGGIGTLHMRETQRKRRKETPTTDATSILLLLLASSSSVRPGGGEGGQLRRRQHSRPGIVSAVSPNSIFWPMLVDTRLTSPEVFFWLVTFVLSDWSGTLHIIRIVKNVSVVVYSDTLEKNPPRTSPSVLAHMRTY